MLLSVYCEKGKPKILDTLIVLAIHIFFGEQEMESQYIRLTDIPAHGREFSFLAADFWQELLRAQGADYFFQPVEAQLTVSPQTGGIFFQGRLAGKLAASCDRCLEPTQVQIEQKIEEFSVFEPDERDTFLLDTDTGMEIDVFLLFWEQLVLALPEKILCSESCKGLCPECGQNRNVADCLCASDAGKNPFSVLRSLQIGSFIL